MSRRWQVLAVIAACMVGIGVGTGAMALRSHSSGGVAAHSDSPVSTRITALGLGGPVGRNATTDGLIRQYQLQVRKTPQDPNAYANLALAYSQKERETSDVSYYTLTQEATAAALHLDPTNYTALTEETWVDLGRHDFRAAADLAERAIKLHDADSLSYANLGDAEANLGNYAAAVAAYQRMINLKPDLASYDRASYTRWLYGDVRGAITYMTLAIRAGSTLRENVAWCQTQLADYFFNAGFLTGARQMYVTALRTFPHYPSALAGLGATDAALGRWRAAIDEYRQATASVPLPQYLTALGDLYSSRGDRADAAKEYAVIAFIDRIFALNHVNYDIETAQFYADHGVHLAEALRLAESTAAVRHDVLTMDTLAWVLYKNGRYADAWRAEKRALRLGTKYALYDFHAGMIQAKLGNVVEGQHYLQTALMINPHFHVLFAPVAQRELVRLNQAATGRVP